LRLYPNDPQAAGGVLKLQRARRQQTETEIRSGLCAEPHRQLGLLNSAKTRFRYSPYPDLAKA
jgi:hypothetical protein